MQLKVFAIKDTKIGFMNPFFTHNEGVAIREFTNGANEVQKNAINTNPEDKELWCLGSFDDETGIMTSEVKFLIKANDVITKAGE
ncbi:MAG: hypothetical protein IKY15_02275 [Clostridia bacterium]|nr:hypothetical protein [Clostridia bacterium]MBR5226461.1 hypothetical protein [Clostridia bacterium]